jgi:FkbM family methyltransferase
MRLNGERKILSLLSKAYRFDTILDVGANHGEWTAMALEEFPGATFHCFEIAPPVFSILARNMPKSSKINLNAFGLADRDERIQINFSADDDGLTSLLTPLDEGSPVSVIEADIRTGDGYLATKGLRAVDYLKVDVEGAEPLVFAGFEEAFRSRRFRCVQFEYGHSDTSLREYYRFFEEHGYRVGKIFPDGCDFGGYTSRRELVASNYIAVRSDEQEIIDTLDSRLRSAGRQTIAKVAVLTADSDELRGLAVKSGGRSTN